MRGGAANGGRQDYGEFGESGNNPTIYTEVAALLGWAIFFELCIPILDPRDRSASAAGLTPWDQALLYSLYDTREAGAPGP